MENGNERGQTLSDLFDDDDAPVVENTLEEDGAERVPIDTTEPAPPVKDILIEYLSYLGIADGKVHFEEDNGELTEKEFKELDADEQLNILKNLYNTREVNDNKVAQKDQELLSQIIEQAGSLENYLAQMNQDSVPTIKDIDDENLFKIDLKSQIAEISEEDLQAEWEDFKDQRLFGKKMAALRQEYIAAEEERISNDLQQEYLRDKETLVEAAAKIDNMHGFDMDSSHRAVLLKDLTELDPATQTSPFLKSIENPDTMVRIAWYLNYGDQAFSKWSEAYQDQENRVRQLEGELKKEKEKNNKSTSSTPLRSAQFVPPVQPVQAKATAPVDSSRPVTAFEDLFE